jgi:hypothetical protein
VRQPAQAEAQAKQKTASRREHAEVGTGERKASTLVSGRLNRGASVATATLLEACDDVGAAVSLGARLCVHGRSGECEQRGCSHYREKLLKSHHWTSELLVSIPSH